MALLAAALWLGVALDGAYDVGVWGPAAAVLGALVIAAALGGRVAPAPAATRVAGALAALGTLSLLSRAWADDRSAALLDGTRWLGLAALVLLAGILVREASARRTLERALLAGALVLEGRLLLGLAGGEEDLLFAGRLVEPVGYAPGQAAALAAGFWLAFAAAERQQAPLRAGLLAGAATAVMPLVLLTQTRAMLPAMAAGAALVIARAEGRERRVLLLLCCLAGAAIAAPAALDPYGSPDVAAALRTTLLWTCVGAGLAGGAFALAARRDLRPPLPPRRAVAVGAGVLALAGATQLPAAWDGFRRLEEPRADRSRLVSAGGNRHDFWRVALEQFADAPAAGVGAGNYPQTYPRLRRSDEYVQQPHSLPLQMLAELGLLGALATLGLLLLLVAGLRGLGTAGTGMVVLWLVHSMVDWPHLLPAVTGIALAGLLLTRAAPDEPASTPRRGSRPWLPAVAAVLACLTAVQATRLSVADRERAEGRRALDRGDPGAALRHAARALRNDRHSAESMYLRSAALARRDDYDGAVQALLVVATRRPDDFVPWTLLGDLATLRGDAAAARASYREAAERNPTDPGIRRLATG